MQININVVLVRQCANLPNRKKEKKQRKKQKKEKKKRKKEKKKRKKEKKREKNREKNREKKKRKKGKERKKDENMLELLGKLTSLTTVKGRMTSCFTRRDLSQRRRVGAS